MCSIQLCRYVGRGKLGTHLYAEGKLKSGHTLDHGHPRTRRIEHVPTSLNCIEEGA